MADKDGGACHTKSCDAEPAHRVFWPGASPPPEMCQPCAGRAAGVAVAMGFDLAIEPLTERTKESDHAI